MEKIKTQEKKNSGLKNFLSIIILLLASAIVIFLLVKDDIDGLVDALAHTKWIFVVYALGLMFLVYMLDAVCLLLFTREFKRDYSFKEAMQNVMIGAFLSGITPSSTGGQFVQAYAFSKSGVSVEKSSTILVLMYIMYQFGTIFCSGVALLFFYGKASELIPNVNLFGMDVSFVGLILIGFLINLCAMLLPLWISYSKLANKLVVGIVKLLSKIKIVKKPDETIEKVNLKITGYRNNLSSIKGRGKTVAVSFAITVVRFIVYFAITYFVALGLGVEYGSLDFALICAFACFVYMLSMFIVTPGGSGGAEAFFALFFANILVSVTGTSLVNPGMILWRFVSFYIPLIICSIVTIVFNKRKNTHLMREVPDEFRWIFYRHHKKEEEKNELQNNEN